MTFLTFLPIVFAAVVGVQPATRFLLDVKPLELSILGNEYCEYGLGIPPPQKWCVCWGKIDRQIEVLPWDCETYALKLTKRRKKRDGHSRWELENFLYGLKTRNNLFPEDLLKGSQWKNPVKLEDRFVERVKEPKDPFDRGLQVIFKEDQKEAKSSLGNNRKFMLKADSGRGSYYDSLLLASVLSMPFLYPYVKYSGSEGSPLEQSISALKLLLIGLEDARSIEDIELYLIRAVAYYQTQFLLKFKNSVVTEIEELLQILKGKNVTAADGKDDSTKIQKNSLWNFIEKGMSRAGEQKKDNFAKKFKTPNSGLNISDLNWLKNAKDTKKVLNLLGPRNKAKMADFFSTTIAKAIILAGLQKNLSDLDSILMKILAVVKNPDTVDPVSTEKSSVMSKLRKSEDAGQESNTLDTKVPPQDVYATPSDSFNDPTSTIDFPKDSVAESTEKSFARPKIQALVKNVMKPIPVNSRSIENGTLKTENPSRAANRNISDLAKHESSFNSAVSPTDSHKDSARKEYGKSSAGPKFQAAANLLKPKSVNSLSIENDSIKAEDPSQAVNDGNFSEFAKRDSSSNNSVIPNEMTKDSMTEKSSAGPKIQIPAHMELVNAHSLKNDNLETGTPTREDKGNSSGLTKRDEVRPTESPKDSTPESTAKSPLGPKIRDPANSEKTKPVRSRNLKNIKSDSSETKAPSLAANGNSSELERKSFGDSVSPTASVKLQNTSADLRLGDPNLKIINIDLKLNDSTPENSTPKNSEGLKLLPRPADARHW